MVTPTIKFTDTERPEFYKEVRKRVNKYFNDTGISRHANFAMVFKTIFMIALYLVPFALILTSVVTSPWLVILMWCIMGFGMAGIGLSVMHDANHGAYSKNQKVNRFVGVILAFCGGFPANWRIQHNVLHHSFTNIEEYDEDIEKGVMRFTPNQRRRKIFKYQIFYAPILYGILTLYWVLIKDYEQLVNYKKKNLLAGQGLTFRSALAQVIFQKVLYFGLILALPIWLLSIPLWTIIVGFIAMHFIAGMALALIFQSAHVLQETEFYVADENGCVDNDWAIHQMKTTSNFARTNVPLTWFIGGLNYQVEHHLFPNICHVHYPAISKIVKATAEEFNVPYHEHKTFTAALKSHFTLLNQLGTGKYDELHPAT